MSLSGLLSSHAGLDMRRTSFSGAQARRRAPTSIAMRLLEQPYGRVVRLHTFRARHSFSPPALHSVSARNQAHRTVDNPRLSSAASIPGTLGLPLLYSRAGLRAPAYTLGRDLPALSPVHAGGENHAREGGDVPAGMR
jgi:hypothetical protein